MRKIKLQRYEQDTACCTVAAVSSVVNHMDKDLNYDLVKKCAEQYIQEDVGRNGLLTGQICKLLNIVGFKKVTLIDSDLMLFDYYWAKYSKKDMEMAIKESLSLKNRKDKEVNLREIYNWYRSRKYKNIIKIDYEFGKYIRKFIDKNVPVIITFNWHMFFKYPKCTDGMEIDPFNGEYEYHAVAVNGYDSKGIWVVDSNICFHKYSRKKYCTGFYRMNWEHLFVCMGQGELIAAERYEKNNAII